MEIELEDDVSEVLLTMNALAREFEVHSETVRRRLHNAGIEPACTNAAGRSVYGLKAAAMAILGIMTERKEWSEIDPETLPPAERLQMAKARLDETRKKLEDHKITRAEGVLVTAEDCRQQKEFFKSGIIQSLENLPDVVKNSCGDLPPEAIDRIKSSCDALRIALVDI